MTIQSYKLGPGTLKLNVVRSVAIATTNASTNITATTHTFLTGDVGATIAGTGIPVGATITDVISTTQATISSAATASGTPTVTVTPLGGVHDLSCQNKGAVIKCEEEVDEGDDVDVLCGETLIGDEEITHKWKLEGSLVQDIATTGAVAFSYTNRGKQIACEYVPNTVLGRKATFPIRIVPLDFGGDEVKKRPSSDFAWNVPKGFDPVLS